MLQVNIYRADLVGPFKKLTSILANELPFVDASVVNGQTYRYYSTAQNDVGESGPSNSADATPQEVIVSGIQAVWNPNAPAGKHYVDITGAVPTLADVKGVENPTFEWSSDKNFSGAKIKIVGNQLQFDVFPNEPANFVCAINGQPPVPITTSAVVVDYKAKYEALVVAVQGAVNDLNAAMKA